MSDIVERLRVIIQSAQLPWRSDLNDVVRDDPNDDDPWTVAHCGVGEGMAELIAESINAIPLLIARIAELEAENLALKTRDIGWSMEVNEIKASIADEREDAARSALTMLQQYLRVDTPENLALAHRVAAQFRSKR